MKNVAAAVFIRDGSVLLARRAPGQRMAGFWEFPGGKQEERETIFECLEREIREEFNVPCKALEIYCKHVHRYGAGAINLIAIRSELLDHRIELRVHDASEWIQIPELNSYRVSPADIFVSEKLISDYIGGRLA
ncbi:(deoxy)nucleoside triphosphate pyrophosphohydrolase [Breznakiella homolactica]|uniref:8-oxo-dGTP diphosphatase n=1 Tax=Breznakiella homolactica TaxID=2798577 RepID=A0A7T7XPL3_9SPIR|nr:NUDIX domain-containing protein [Breznakiella homolactica]QQO10180.1 NUDIX domain-containing protein [Breznakiella homolactica]